MHQGNVRLQPGKAVNLVLAGHSGPNQDFRAVAGSQKVVLKLQRAKPVVQLQRSRLRIHTLFPESPPLGLCVASGKYLDSQLPKLNILAGPHPVHAAAVNVLPLAERIRRQIPHKHPQTGKLLLNPPHIRRMVQVDMAQNQVIALLHLVQIKGIAGKTVDLPRQKRVQKNVLPIGHHNLKSRRIVPAHGNPVFQKVFPHTAFSPSFAIPSAPILSSSFSISSPI